MVKYRVVTDSTADMDEAEARRLRIAMVPLNVLLNGESYLDKVELSVDEFYRRLMVGRVTPRTSQPPAGRFEAVYRELLEEAEGIISVHISGKLSGTVNAARAAAAVVAPERIVVLDSLMTTYPLGALAVRVARAAEEGASLAEGVALAEELIPRLKLFCILDTLEFLRRGGRIGRAQAWAGSLLSVKPIIAVENGEVVPADRVRTRAAAVKRTAELVRGLGPLEDAAVLYGDNPEPAEQLRLLVQADHPELEVKWGRTGSVIGTHTGPGVVGVCVVLAR